jgi:vancomycin resistance protein YoaR
MLAVVIVGAGASTWSLLPERAPKPEEIPQPELRVAGQAIVRSEDPVGAAVDAVRRYALGEAKLTLPGGRTVPISRAEFGLELDRQRLAEFVKEASRAGSPLQRAHFAKKPGEPLDVPLPISFDVDKAISKLVDIKAEVDKSPRDAVIDLEARTVKPEERGYRLDVFATLARIESAFRSGQTVVEAVVEEVAPKRVAAELDGIKFDHVLGFFETRYNTAEKYEDRTFNLRLAASKLDGTVLMPGEVFDFNGVVGARDEANGYRVAKVIAEGELVDGIGGGTCQISGTLHAAALFAGLDIVERYPHSRPSSYIKLGLDATVSYPNINYKFKNPFDHPVVIHEKVALGAVRAEILGPARTRTVSYFRRIDEILPFEELERESPRVPTGERIVVQRGIPGFRATVSRVTREGAIAEREKWTEKYPPTTQIVAVGTAPEEQKATLVADTHPEYTVDEYLVVTQSPGTGENAMNEQRVPGRTGEAGWIKKLGLEKTPIEPSEKLDEKDDKKSDDKKADTAKDKKVDAKDKKKEKSAKKKARDGEG